MASTIFYYNFVAQVNFLKISLQRLYRSQTDKFQRESKRVFSKSKNKKLDGVRKMYISFFLAGKNLLLVTLHTLCSRH